MNFSLGKKILPWSGRVLMLLGLFFVAQNLWGFREEFGSTIAELSLWMYILIISALYCFGGLFLSYGWLNLLRAQGISPKQMGWSQAWVLYGKTQVAKYIPGNIFHIAGRHAAAIEKGVPHSKLIAAAVLEIVLLLFAAGIVGLVAASQISINPANIWLLPLGLFLFIVVVLAAILGVKNKGALKSMYKIMPLRLAASMSGYTLFLIYSGLLFYFTILIVEADFVFSFNRLSWIISVYAFSWAVGFVTPGIPGGLGIREAIVLALLSAEFYGANLVIGILAFRIVTTFGDVMFFVIAQIANQLNMSKKCSCP